MLSLVSTSALFLLWGECSVCVAFKGSLDCRTTAPSAVLRHQEWTLDGPPRAASWQAGLSPAAPRWAQARLPALSGVAPLLCSVT